MRFGALAVAVAVAFSSSGCGGEGPRPPPDSKLRAVELVPLGSDGTARLVAPDDALSHDALDVRALIADQALALDRTLRRCLARIPATADGPLAATRFRACAFRQLAHTGVAERLNAVLALTLTRRLRGGNCRTSLLAVASAARRLAVEADAILRELNSNATWSADERGRLLALQALARDTRASLSARALRRQCAPVDLVG